MSNTMTLAEAIEHYDVDVLEHLDREVAIPILTALPQRQGDVLFMPSSVAKPAITPVPKDGHPVVRGENGGNTHLLLEGWGAPVFYDPAPERRGSLALGTLTVPEGSVAYLAHPEHGYMGFGAGTYAVSRQREQADEIRMVAD